MIDTDALLLIAHNANEEGDFDRARKCYEQGAKLGDAQCLQSLAYMYDVGKGVDEDKKLAMALYRKAWRKGSHAAASNIAILYREQGKHRTMFRWFERMAVAGDGSAQLDLAKCYLSGLGVRKNPQAALRCLNTAVSSFYISESEREEAQALQAELAPRSV